MKCSGKSRGKCWGLNVLRAMASGVLIWFVLSHVNVIQVFLTLRRLLGYPIVLAVVSMIVAALAATWKWRELLRAQGIKTGFFHTLCLTYIAAFYNLVLPGQESGNGVKALLLGRSTRKASKVWASVMIDQILLFMASLVISIPGLILIPRLPDRNIWISTIAFCFVGVVFLHSLFLIPGLSRAIDRVLCPLSWHLRIRWVKHGSGEWLAPVWQSLCSYQTTVSRLGLVLGLSLLYQLGIISAAFWLATGLGIHVSFINFAWVMILVSLAQALPVSIAGIGMRDGVLAFFLVGQLGVLSYEAVALSFAILALNILVGIPGAFLQMVPQRSFAVEEAHTAPLRLLPARTMDWDRLPVSAGSR
jgi:uncharacterized protein (TIRG00374 family)